jgi:hypothetical protein
MSLHIQREDAGKYKFHELFDNFFFTKTPRESTRILLKGDLVSFVLKIWK